MPPKAALTKIIRVPRVAGFSTRFDWKITQQLSPTLRVERPSSSRKNHPIDLRRPARADDRDRAVASGPRNVELDIAKLGQPPIASSAGTPRAPFD
jgi:hypothetical protein